MNKLNGQRLPHSVRLVVFFLRLIVGLSLFYAGFSKIFGGSVVRAPSRESSYLWTSGLENIGSMEMFAQWGLLIIGICLAIGLLTRLSSIVGIFILGFMYVNSLSLPIPKLQQLDNPQLIAILCLFLFIFSQAGNYLGVDKFIHFSLRHDR
ncbi:MAG: DoxX family protein [Candidatus Liptonbacteria bacterium]